MIFIRKTAKYLIITILIISFLFPADVLASTVPSGGTVDIAGGRLNVRSSPSSSATVLTKLNKGAYVTLHSKNGSWWYLEYGKNQFGYCHSSYITSVGGTQRMVYTTSGSLKVRSGPGTSYSTIAGLSSGEKVIVLSSSGYWSRVLYHGNKKGYVYNTYLGPVGNTGSNTPAALNVPSYKQYDSRWSSVKIGSYGETIGTIGCATTAIAMMESYRSGTTITPLMMRNRLTYTPSGSVYWPSDYTAVTDSYNYLYGIYRQLKAGKPVLLGLKNSYGGQHWVIVKGFKGGSITASNFTVNDPGSDKRMTLSQVLLSYPNFYKYFSY